MKKPTPAEKRALMRLQKHWPEALALAHTLNDCIALDLYAMMRIANEAGIRTFDEFNATMACATAKIIIAKDHEERKALRDRADAYRRALKRYGYHGAALSALLIPFSTELPPAPWQMRVLLGDDGRVYDAAGGIEPERHDAAPSTTCNSTPRLLLH